MAELAELKNIVEAALLAAGRPLSLDNLQSLFNEVECPDKKELRGVLEELADDYRGRGIEITEVASGWRIQVRKVCSPWVSRLWEERPARYSRALMETLALIAYRQPITRGDIEDIRGVSVSTNIVKTLMEREWVHVVGHRDVPGKPSLYGTTREFLDYFGLKSLDELPTLAELRDLDEINRELDLNDPAITAPKNDEAGPLPQKIALAAGAPVGSADDSEISPETAADIDAVVEAPATDREAPRPGAVHAASTAVAADEDPAGEQSGESDVLVAVEAHAEVAAERS
jgi:segregation and condensation protein B